ncbi:MAG: metal-dependent hydrolase [Verrucomicrobiae bacterium]|nr:metal-dependent hydrolase [Verrucomicrobiae bacterium]
MDPLSQGVVGAVCAQSVAGKRTRIAGVAGALGGMLADLDVLIRSSEDPLLAIEYHRHFTHALVFIPVGGLIASLLLWLPFRNKLRFRMLYLFSTLGYATAGLLDACTSYGTQLLWPFADNRIAWNVISIIDPLFTFPLVILAAAAFYKKTGCPARIAVVFLTGYLLFGTWQRDRAEAAALNLAQSRNHPVERITVKPSIFNLVVWRSIYESNGRYHIDALRVLPFRNPRYFAGASIPVLQAESLQDRLPAGSTLSDDIARFAHFSDHYLALHPDHENVIGDVRYSMLPNGLEPLWGIEIDLREPDSHAFFKTFREPDKASAQMRQLWDMIRGRGAEGVEGDGYLVDRSLKMEDGYLGDERWRIGFD